MIVLTTGVMVGSLLLYITKSWKITIMLVFFKTYQLNCGNTDVNHDCAQAENKLPQEGTV